MNVTLEDPSEDPEDDDDYEYDDDDEEDENIARISLDPWIKFYAEKELAKELVDLRTKWHSIVIRRMQQPSKWSNSNDESLITALVELLTIEENVSQLVQPVGVGLRPKPYAPSNTNNTPVRRNYTPNTPATSIVPRQVRLNQRKPDARDKLLQGINASCRSDSSAESNASSLFDSIREYGNQMNMMTNSFSNMSTRHQGRNQGRKGIHNTSTEFENNGRIMSDSDESSNCIIPENRRYFIIKVPSLHMIENSVSKKTWLFQPHLEPQFLRVLQVCK